MLNQVQLIGNVGKGPEVRVTQGGERVANFSLATTEKWKDRNSGERKEATEWHRIVVWGNLAEIVESYVIKGSKVYVCGKIKTRKWTDQSGVEKYSTEIVLTGFDAKLLLLGDRQGVNNEDEADEARDRGRSNGNGRAASGGRSNGNGGGRKPAPPQEDLDDEIPF